jgi:hypothetical protein
MAIPRILVAGVYSPLSHGYSQLVGKKAWRPRRVLVGHPELGAF